MPGCHAVRVPFISDGVTERAVSGQFSVWRAAGGDSAGASGGGVAFFEQRIDTHVAGLIFVRRARARARARARFFPPSPVVVTSA